MKKTKKVLSFVLAIIMVFSIIPITASAETVSGTCGENLTWEFDDSTGTLTISGTGAMYDYNNSNYNSRPWNGYEDSIKTVVIGDNVTSIGNYAFRDCTSISNVTIGNCLITIGCAAFWQCYNLTNIEISESVIEFGSYAFYNCDSLTSIIIPNNVTTISDWMFYACDNLTTVILGENVNQIGTGAFACSGLKSILLPDCTLTIGEEAFACCKSLVSIIIPDSVVSIADYAFDGCTNLARITVESNNQYYSNDEYGVLFNRDKTTLIQYPIGNTRTSYTISDRVTSVNSCAIYDCRNLKSIIVDSSNQYYSNDENGALFNKDKTILIQYPIGNTKTNYIIPNSVTSIGWHAFSSCDNLINIAIPDSLTSIGYYAFQYCNNLTDVYYSGTEKEWNKISIGEGNVMFRNANIHFNYCPHEYTSVVTELTCTSDGYTTYTCSLCGDSYVDNYVEATGHKYNSVVTNPTCTESGYTTCTCECGDTYIANITPATGHNDSDNDGYCEICDKLICSHNCHKTGFEGFFWKIANFFNKLFGSNKYCDCGATHY